MGKTCAWCGTVLRTITGTAIPTSQALCQGCLDELQGALSSSGLKGAATEPGISASS
jgi:hypothetical protein